MKQKKRQTKFLNQQSEHLPAKQVDDPMRNPYVGSMAELIDKYLLTPTTRKETRLVVVLIIIGVIIIQDNEAGRLQDWQGIRWALLKCFLAAGFYFILYVYRLLVRLGKRLLR